MANESVRYDASVIQEFADRLYREAASIVIKSTIFGALVGAIVLVVLAVVVQQRENLGTGAAIGALLGGLVGYSRGESRAFELRLRAQQALCQVQIERHTNVLNALIRTPKPP
jgi:hypothetical protein